MKKQVTYLISGTPHIPYLVASLYTLRQYYKGMVEVHSWPESFKIIKRISLDNRLDISCVEREPKLRKKDGVGGNSQFLDKIDMTMGLDCDVSMYLDADTTIHGDISPLMNVVSHCDYVETHYDFIATQWNDWVTTGRRVSGRIRALLDVDIIPDRLIKQAMSQKYPSVNGGVWVARPSSRVLLIWYKWTLACKSLFIADERVLHLMEPLFNSPMNFMVACADGKWNSSPKHQSKTLKDEDVVIRHYHGDSNVRPDKSEKGFQLWWPIWMECCRLNVGGCMEWKDAVGNRWLKKLETLYELSRFENAVCPDKGTD